MKWVLSKFNESLLTEQFIFGLKFAVYIILECTRLELVNIILVLSVNKTGLDFSVIVFDKLFV
jgi:hypothetical protein